MNIEEIMKPYFDKKEELERKQEINNKYIEEKRILELRLERLRDNKKEEIEEYVKNAVSDRPDFYIGYGAMIRKDLEQAYVEREQRLEREIRELDEKMQFNSNELTKYHRLDVRELVDVKHDLRKELIAAKKELEIKLRENQLSFDVVMHKLTTFKYEYDENHNVLNGNEYRNLFELSNSLIEVKYSLQRDLKQIEEYLKVTELTEEEIKTVMMSMTPWEKEEYDRRKTLINQVEEIIQETPEINQNIELVEESRVEEPKVEEKIETPLVDRDQEIYESARKSIEEQNKTEEVEFSTVGHEQKIFESAEKAIEEQNKLEENYSEFMKEVFGDVLSSVDKLRTIKIENGKYISAVNPGKEKEEYEIVNNSSEENIELANGLYINQKDLDKALNNYKKQNKGRSFTVKGIDLVLNITRKSVNKVKKALRKASSIKLISEKKLSVFDIKRVYGKEKADEYTNEIENYNQKTKMPTGNYVLLTDAYEALKDLFVEKKQTWFERFASKSKELIGNYIDNSQKVNDELVEEIQDAEYEQLEEVEPSLSWNAEEPEYEVVKGKTR